MRAPFLSAEQKHVRERLVARARGHLRELAGISEKRCRNNEDRCERIDALAELKSPRISNALGVFGRRGSGKTTVLIEILRNLRDEPAKDAPGWRVLDQPLDLSYAPREFPHGLTMVHWMHERLRNEDQRYANSKAVQEAFDCTSHSYFRGAEGFNQMVRDLAVSAEQYAQVAAHEISKRMSLRVDIQRWLDVSASVLKTEGLVVAVDDADLAPANRHQNLVWSLLDELHQDRLLIIAAGDLLRLERRLAEEDASARKRPLNTEGTDRRLANSGLDLQAAQDLAYKVLPQVDRAELEPWPRLLRPHFPPPGSTRSAYPVSRSIKDLREKLPLHSVLIYHFDQLLPEWPRGLENVHRELEQLTSAEPSSDTRRLNVDLLRFLAESSFDFMLARQLRERELNDWAPSFAWTTAASIDWNDLEQRLRSEFDLYALIPDPGLLPLENKPRWAELLIDWSLDEGTLTPWHFLQRVPGLQQRLARAEIALERTDESFDRIQSDDAAELWAALPWLRWNDTEELRLGRFAMGALPLLQWLVGERVLIPSAMESCLWNLGEDEPERETLPIPRRARDLIRMVDALARQPWDALSDPSPQVSPLGLARMAAALTYSALRQIEEPDFVVALESYKQRQQWDDQKIAEWFVEVVAEHASVGAEARVPDSLVAALASAAWFRRLLPPSPPQTKPASEPPAAKQQSKSRARAGATKAAGKPAPRPRQ